jgi:electron transport complex protein RnfG
VSDPAAPVRAEGFRLAATLAVAGLLSGLAIVSAFRLTEPAIRAHQAEALKSAVFQVLPGAERMERRVWAGEALAAAAAGSGDLEDSIFAGFDGDGRLVGYAVPAAGPGFQDTIKLIFGLDPAGEKVIGLAILESRETPGLGDRIYKDPHFLGEFKDLAVEPVIVVVKGHGENPNEVDAITGATISSKSVVKIVNKACALWRPRLPAPGAAPPAPPAAADKAAAVPPDVDRGGPVPGGGGGGGEKP